MPQAPLTSELIDLPNKIKDASGLNADLVTTPEGEWAVQVSVGPGAETPIPEVETAAGPHRVLYQLNTRVMTARPAFPKLGE